MADRRFDLRIVAALYTVLLPVYALLAMVGVEMLDSILIAILLTMIIAVGYRSHESS